MHSTLNLTAKRILVRNPASPPWSDQDTNRARALIAAGADDATFIREIGRTYAAAKSRVRYVDYPELRKPPAPRKANARPAKNTSLFYVPAEVVSDAVRRMHAQRSLTALIFGDPGPGQSALDRRNRSEAPNGFPELVRA
jgi:hypothetical protein